MERRADRDVAARVAVARVARRLTQDQLARAAAISVSLLRKIEHGDRHATPPVLRSIAEALGLDLDQLTETMTVTDSRVHDAIPLLRRALDAYDFPDDGPVCPLSELSRAVVHAERCRLTSQYARMICDLPALLTQLGRLNQCCNNADRPIVARLLVSAFRSVDGVVYKYGYHDLSARVIELMRRAAAEAADDQLNAAVAYVRTETFFATNNLSTALRALNVAAAQLPPGAPEATAAYGALHMRAAVVSGRMGSSDAAWSHLLEARDAAARVPEGVYHGTAFGPDSVRVHEIAVSVELGDEQAALRVAAGWTPPVELPAERRSHYFLELARAQLWAGRREATFTSLQAARQIAPQHVREHPQVRETVTTLLRLGRAPGADLLNFAHWLKVV
jgi:transcriptional regulator with XRE-family HTH domain